MAGPWGYRRVILAPGRRSGAVVAGEVFWPEWCLSADGGRVPVSVCPSCGIDWDADDGHSCDHEAGTYRSLLEVLAKNVEVLLGAAPPPADWAPGKVPAGQVWVAYVDQSYANYQGEPEAVFTSEEAALAYKARHPVGSDVVIVDVPLDPIPG